MEGWRRDPLSALPPLGRELEQSGAAGHVGLRGEHRWVLLEGAEGLSNVKEQGRAQQHEWSSVQLPWIGL